jgi:hypothetical protein
VSLIEFAVSDCVVFFCCVLDSFARNNLFGQGHLYGHAQAEQWYI